VRDLSVAGWSIYVEFERWRVKCPKCVSVHVEHLDWLAENPRYTQRKEEDLDEFFNFIGKSKCKRIDLAVMDMWKAFRNSTQKNAPQALISYGKFHIIIGQLWNYKTARGCSCIFLTMERRA
jgi:transposase